MKKYSCWDCLGSGKKSYYHMIDNGTCYTCGGTGFTNKVQGEVSKAHQENVENIKQHAKIMERIKKGKNVQTKQASIVAELIQGSKDHKEELNKLSSIGDLLKALESEYERLNKIINWS
jgi:uncharacterized coiled-coil DUF342 family protein